MFLDKGSLTGKKNRILVGYDLGNETSQISYCYPDEREPETVSVITGEWQFDFPTALCRRVESDQWAYGKEAVRLAQEGQGVLVSNLLTLAREGDEAAVGGERFDPVSLLALFMKRSLSLLGMVALPDQIEGLMVTVEDLDHRTVEAVGAALSVMQMKTEKLFMQSHAESFFSYVVHQPDELWKGQTLLLDYRKDSLRARRLECNRHTTPIAAFAENWDYPKMPRQDESLLSALERLCGAGVSAAYLIGSGFDGDWYPNSLRYLCRGRRVFRGNNLYSKGACYGIREKLKNAGGPGRFVFLGEDKLKANLGMRLMRQGKEVYHALLDAGVSWFEAKAECEFILENGTSFSLLVTSLTGKESREIEIVLNDMPKRAERATRVRMEMTMMSETRASVSVEDLGFGEIYPATHRIWREEFDL